MVPTRDLLVVFHWLTTVTSDTSKPINDPFSDTEFTSVNISHHQGDICDITEKHREQSTKSNGYK